MGFWTPNTVIGENKDVTEIHVRIRRYVLRISRYSPLHDRYRPITSRYTPLQDRYIC